VQDIAAHNGSAAHGIHELREARTTLAQAVDQGAEYQRGLRDEIEALAARRRRDREEAGR
jgi:hypothetical protein